MYVETSNKKSGMYDKMLSKMMILSDEILVRSIEIFFIERVHLSFEIFF